MLNILSDIYIDLLTPTVRKNSGDDVGTRRKLNFVEGTNITLTIADDETDEEVDITITGAETPAPTTTTETILYVIDGTGSAITVGEKGHLVVDYACTIQSATLVADQSGSIVVDVWKDSYANFPPTDADSITASAPPTLSGAAKSQDTTLTGWTKNIAAGNILAFNVDSAATVTRVTLALKVVRT